VSPSANQLLTECRIEMGCAKSKEHRKIKRNIRKSKSKCYYSLLEMHQTVRTKGGCQISRLIADGEFRIIGPRICSGSFGEIFPAVKVGDNNTLYAVKIEPATTEEGQLEHEFRMYKRFKDMKGIPRGYWFGKDLEKKHNMLVMDMLGPSIEYLLGQNGKPFTVKTCLLLVDQLIPILKTFHDNYFIHRDLKPANIVMGHIDSPDKNKTFLIDFGLSKKYKNEITQEQRPFEIRYRGLIGTSMFCSIGSEMGLEQSPKDDMESLGYILFYLMGELPWQNCEKGMSTQEYLRSITEKKRSIAVENYSKITPIEFVTYVKEMRNLKFTDRPPYKKMIKMFRSLAKKKGIKYDNRYDWTGKPRY